MARKRIVKSTPKRGKLSRSKVRRVVREVIRERREREAIATAKRTHSAVSTSKPSPKED